MHTKQTLTYERGVVALLIIAGGSFAYFNFAFPNQKQNASIPVQSSQVAVPMPVASETSSPRHSAALPATAQVSPAIDDNQTPSEQSSSQLAGELSAAEIASIPQPQMPESGILSSDTMTAPNGSIILISKILINGEIEKRYETADGVLHDQESFKDWIESFPAKKTSSELDNFIEANPTADKLLVVIALKGNARRQAAQAARDLYDEEVSDLRSAFSASNADKHAINQEYDELQSEIRASAASVITNLQRENKKQLVAWLERNGSHVRKNEHSASGELSAEIPADLLQELTAKDSVRLVDLNVNMESSLDVSVPAMSADSYWDGGIDGGESAYDPGVLDSGIDGSHPALSGLTVNYHVDHYWASRDSSYDDSWSTGDDYHGHGTAVAGIITSKGSYTWEDWVGVAPGITSRLYNLKSAYLKTNGNAGLYYSDAIDNIDWGIFQSSADDIDLLNFSYGSTSSSDDTSLGRFLDAVVDDLEIPVISAAGNYGPNSNTLVYPATAYNVISVASMNDINTLSRSDDVVAYSSSRGPTPGGRKKPDITAPGSYIQTTNSKWESQSDFTSWSGTSFAAPHITGAVQLLMDEYGPPADPLKVKAVLINTTDKWGSLEWNSTYGWGYVNLDNAWSRKDDVFRYHVSPEGSSDDFDLFVGTFNSGDTATLVWNRHVAYSSGGNYPSTWYGLNDLDLRVYRKSDGTMLDWSTSGVDNVEQVTITSGTIDCVIRVEANDSSFSGVSQESYALATPPGFAFSSALPSINVLTYSDNNIQPGETYKVTSVISNSGDIDVVNGSLDLTLPSGHTLISGTSTVSLATLQDNESNSEVLIWEVQAPGSTGSGNVTTDVTSSCWGETWTDDDYRTIAVNSSANAQPRIRVETVSSHASASLDSSITLTATVSNEATQASGDASDVSIELVMPPGYELISGSSPTVISSLPDGTDSNVAWTVKPTGSESIGTHGFRILATDTDGSSTLRGTDAIFINVIE